MNSNYCDLEKGDDSKLYSQEEALCSSSRKSDAFDEEFESNRRSCSSLFNIEIGSKRFKSARWEGCKENGNEQEIRISRASSFTAQRPSFSVGVPVQVPHVGNVNFNSYDVEEGRDHDGVDLDIHKTINGYDAKNKPLPIALQFSDVRYKVNLSQNSSWKKMRGGNKASVLEKEILHGITGSVKPGELLAMMGPSGSGKTTLLNLLGGRNQNQMSGTIKYNGLPFNKTLKRRLGFVTQDDVLYPHLTVRETLMYAALLLLPKELSKKEKIQHAEQVIADLRLERCRDTRIGGPFLRGVSGGERKRVCIGHELLMDPSLILLDEPTSGLDSTIATRIIQLLKNISLQGRTVVTTIHQPSSRVFHSFTKLILLSEGSLIYFGKASAAVEHFSSLGFTSQIAMNPADFLLDLSSGNTDDMSMPLIFQKHVIKTKDIHEYMVTACESMKPQMIDENKSQCEIEEIIENQSCTRKEWGASWWLQFNVLLIRGLKESRHEYLSWLRLIQIIAISVMSGILWWQSNIKTEKALEDQIGLLFFVAMFWGYFPLFTAIFVFPADRALLAKERTSNMYRLSAYFLARTLGDLPLELSLTGIFVVIVYFMAGLQLALGPFLFTIMTIFLTVITSQGLGLAIGAALMDVKKATTLASVLVLAFTICGGFFVQRIPAFVSWLRYCSFHYHTFKLLMKVQYSRDQVYNCTSPGGCKSIESSSAFHDMNLEGGGTEVWAMLAMAACYRLFAYIALRRMKLNF